MALGREIQDFLGAFQGVQNAANTMEMSRYRRARRRAIEANDPANSPEVKDAYASYKAQGGTAPFGGPLTAGNAADYGIANMTPEYEHGVVPAFKQGGLVMNTPGHLTATQRAQRDAGPDIPELPDREYDDEGQQTFDGVRGQSDANWNEPPVPLPYTAYDDPSLDEQRRNMGDDGPWPDVPVNHRGDPIYNAPMTHTSGVLPVTTGGDRTAQQGVLPTRAGAPSTPTQVAPGAGGGGGAQAAGSPTAAPKRKALNDQTRTEAYDPELDGPGAAGGSSAAGVTPPGNVAAGTPDQGGTGRRGGYDPAKGGEGQHNSASADFEAALDGAMKFAADAFHLGGGGSVVGPDRKQGGGQQAFIKGVGAADPAMVQQIDQRVNRIPGMRDDPAIWGIRRLEAVYRFYSRTGQTDKANKAAFELIQYSAGMAARHGEQALAQLKAGNQQGAIQQLQQGYNQIPDGRRMQVNGDRMTVTDARTGDVVENIQFTPQMVFNAALGLSDRSLYWNAIMNRVNATQKRTGRSETQEELDRARIELTRARTAKVKGGGTGRGGGSGTSPALQNLITQVEGIDASRGKAPSTPSEPRTPPQGSNDGGDDLDEDGGAVDRGDAPPGQGARPANYDGEGDSVPPAPPLDMQESPLRLKPRPGRALPVGDGQTPAAVGAAPAAVTSPAQGRPAAFDPESDGYDYETARAAGIKPGPDGHWPSRDPRTGTLLKGKNHPTFQKGVDEDAKLGYYMRKRDDGRYETFNPDEVPEDRVFARNGQTYEPITPEGKPTPFDREKPGPNPYRPLLTEAAKIPGKDGVRARQLINAKIKEYDDQAKSYDRDRRAHDRSEATRVRTETAAARKEQKDRMRETYDRKLDPAALKAMKEDLDTQFTSAVERLKAEKKLEGSVFGDKSIDADTFKDIAVSVATSNPNVDTAKAVRMVTDLMRAGDEPGERAYVVRGRDPLGNVIVTTETFGPIHLRPQAWSDLTKIVRARNDAAVKRKADAAKPKEPSRVSKAYEEFKRTAAPRGGETPLDAAKRHRRQAPSSPTANVNE